MSNVGRVQYGDDDAVYIDLRSVAYSREDTLALKDGEEVKSSSGGATGLVRELQDVRAGVDDKMAESTMRLFEKSHKVRAADVAQDLDDEDDDASDGGGGGDEGGDGEGDDEGEGDEGDDDDGDSESMSEDSESDVEEAEEEVAVEENPVLAYARREMQRRSDVRDSASAASTR